METGFPSGSGLVEEIDWDGNVVWRYKLWKKNKEVQHHTVHRMPNGNTMILAWEVKPKQEGIDKGRDPNTLPTKPVKQKGVPMGDWWVDFVREVDKDGNTVKPSHDGVRFIAIAGGKLLREPWPFPYFHVPMFRPKPRAKGYWSRGLPEILAGNQHALNKMAKRIDGILDLHARPLIYVWRNAKVNTRMLTNAWGNIIEGNAPPGQAIQYITPQSVPGDYIRRYREIIEDSERQAGVSELSISAKLPPGVEHAPALQHVQDTESLRHTPGFRAWETVHVDGSRAVVDCLRLLTEHAKREQKDLSLLWGESKQLKRLKPEDWDISEDRYHLKVWPTNLLPQTPSAKISRIVTMIEGRLMPPEKGMQALALEFPDIESLLGDASAAERNVTERLKAIEAGESYEQNMPEAYMDLQLAGTLVVNRINALGADGHRGEKIDKLRKFYEDVQELLQKTQPPVDTPPEPPPLGPEPGVPAAPPMPPAEGAPPAITTEAA